MALVCGYGPINPPPWMAVEASTSMLPTGSSVVNMGEKLMLNPGLGVPGPSDPSRTLGPQELGQFGGDRCRNPGCKCQVLKTKSTYGYVRHVRRSHGLPTQVSRRICEYGNFHVDSRFTKPLSVDTGTEYELPKHLYPPKRSDPILMIHPSYKRYLGIKQRFTGACNPVQTSMGVSTNYQWSDQIKRCGSAQRQCVDTNQSSGQQQQQQQQQQTFPPPQYAVEPQMHPQMVSHIRQSSLPVSVAYTRMESRNIDALSGATVHYRSSSEVQVPQSMAAFMPTCADLGIPVSRPQQLQPQFKIPTLPTACKRPKQDFPSTSQFQPIYSQADLPPPYWSNKENSTSPFFSQASTSAMSMCDFYQRGVNYGASTSTLQMPMNYSMDQSRLYALPVQQQMPQMPLPPSYYEAIKFAHPAPQMASVGDGGSGSNHECAIAAPFPVAYSTIPSGSVAQTNPSVAQYSIHPHMMTARSSQDLSLQVPRDFDSSVDTQLIQSTQLMMTSMSDFADANAEESAMRSARRLPKSGKTRAMRFHTFYGDRES